MKKLMLLAVLAVFCTSAYCQKVKTKTVTTTKTKAAAGPTAGMIKNNFYLILDKGKKDTILLKKMANGKLPKESKVSLFSAKGTKLYNISWSEVVVTETKNKTEEATTIFNEIWNLDDRIKVFSNAQTTTKIKQLHWLDKNETVSETREKLRKEGFICSLTADGDVVLKNKTQENKLVYNPTEKKYLNSK